MSILAVIGLLAFQEPPADPVEMNVTHAFNRMVAPGWQPYLITLHNTLPQDLALTLQADHASTGLLITRRVVLPAGATQKFILYVWPSYLHEEIIYRVLGPDGKPLSTPQRHNVEGYGWRANFEVSGLLVLSHKPDTGTLLGLPQDLAIGRTAVETRNRFVCPPERFPDQVVALQHLAAILLHDYRIAELSPSQRTALRDYVGGGGVLVVVPGVDSAWLNDPLIQEMAPVKVRGEERITDLTSTRNDSGQRFVVAGERAGLIDGDKLWHSDTPALFFDLAGGTEITGSHFRRFRYGFGEVLVAEVDFDRYGLNAWDGTEALWHQALGSVAGGGTAALPLYVDDSEYQLLRWLSMNLRRTPPLMLLLGLTLAYVALIGPVHLFAVRRLKRPLWALATIPLTAGLFVAVIFATGLLLRGRSTVGQQFTMLQSFSGQPVARERTLFTLHSPTDHSYDVEAPPGVWMEPEAEMDPYRSRSDWIKSGFTMEQRGDHTALAAVAVGQWQTRFFTGRRFVPVGEGIRFSATEAAATVANFSDRRLRAAALLIGGEGPSTVTIGPVEPGTEVQAGPEGRRAGYHPVEALGLDPESPEARVLSEWVREQRNQLRGLPPMLIAVLEPPAAAVGVEVGRREQGALWIVYPEPRR